MAKRVSPEEIVEMNRLYNQYGIMPRLVGNWEEAIQRSRGMLS